ncbi:hypothetical protein [Prevotella sp. P4-98]|uniref:hypothetical protein n=1 Tax=Prevotella sp. P4-98 TaxID=2024219 RepID=UPI00118001A8|nr:hypothetical protein [Prevotella sp. P4-98]
MTFNFVPGNHAKVEVKITKHQHSSSQISSEATCTTVGHSVQCDVCGAWGWNNDGTFTNTTENDYKPVLGHDFTGQEWTTDEVNGNKYRTCTRSGCEHKQYTYDVVPVEPALGITLNDDVTLTYPQSLSPVYAKDGMMWKVKLGKTTACELSLGQVKGIVAQWPHNNTDHQCADKSWADGCSVEGCAEGRTQRWVNINGNKVETTAITGDLAIASLTLDDAKGYECEAEYTANAVSYGRTMTNQWGTLCLPFEIKSDQYATCKFYELKEVKETEIVLTEVTGNIPAGTPVLVRRNTEGTNISLNATNAAITVAPAASSSANGFSLVGRFTASGALPQDSYIISNNKFWRVSNLTPKEGVTDVKVGPFRAYLQSNGVQNVRMMSLSIGDDDTTAIDVLNAADEGEAEIYDLNGHRLQGLQKGMNIVKRGNKTTKVIIK